jgi:hypothetical protein
MINKNQFDEWLFGKDTFISYLFKSVIGMGFSIIIINLILPDYLNHLLLPIDMVITRNVFILLIFASLGLIVSFHMIFLIYFALPYLLIKKWWNNQL